VLSHRGHRGHRGSGTEECSPSSLRLCVLLLCGLCGLCGFVSLPTSQAVADEVDDWRAAAIEAIEKGNAAEAAALIERVLARRPDDQEARFGLGVCYFRLNEPLKARAALEEVLAADPRHVMALEVLGRLDYDEDRTATAIARWRAALEIDPENARVKDLLAKAEREHAVEEGFREDYTQHFRLRFDGDAAGAGGDPREVERRVGALLEAAYERVGASLGHYPRGEITAVLYADRTFYALTGSHAWVGGLFDGKIRIPAKDAFKADAEALRRVCFHEYAHAAVHSIAPQCPAWLQEGLAQHYEGAPLDADLLRGAAASQGLLALADLDAPFVSQADAGRARLAYAQSHAFIEHLLAAHGTAPLLPFLEAIGRGAAVAEAFESAYHRPLGEAFDAFRAGFGR